MVCFAPRPLNRNNRFAPVCAFSRDVGCCVETIDGVEDECVRGGGGGSERTKNMARVHVERVGCLFARLLPFFLFFLSLSLFRRRPLLEDR